ncbi:hypothetical protein BABINDRAFT_160387 [Babjeviella inositovora NRRL Y-12698]|uniref:Alpha/beta hydrolase fold-3 domain-containing protein n=1 Tax=Babjeviella inositovora NRRL Y-12698 TaxID=984486 RepID=A0A1E3QTE8_9ASCO|nr:uncharacterized protein BABINDRAFT_160387 [Babjeviella inositovora NRRL Y-12698]ODQ80951.1 hypothetical protein BABINDRAFT_160387 [Babjeviella inositovora NRRL Y-12698]
MISLKFLALLFLLPSKLLYQTILYFTVGSNFACKDIKTLLHSVASNHILDYVAASDLIGVSGRKVTIDQTLAGVKKTLTTEGHLPSNFGKMYLGSKHGRSHWIVEAPDRTTADPVVLYLHGGGFLFPTFDTQLKALVHIHRGLQNDRLSILLVDYSLSPEVLFPGAINQVAHIFHKLVVQEGNTNIWLMGDSAGGNMCVVLLKHIHSPINAITTVIPERFRPRGAILISPWLNLDPKPVGSYLRNAKTDILTFGMYRIFSEMYHPDTQLRRTLPISPFYSQSSDWEGVLPGMLLVLGGESEVIVDELLRWVEIAKIDRSSLGIQPRGMHDEFMLYTETFESYKESYAYTAITKFLKDNL